MGWLDTLEILLDNDGVSANAHDIIVAKYRRLGHPVRRSHIDDWEFGTFARIIGKTQEKILHDDFFPLWEENWQQIKLMDPDVPEVYNEIMNRWYAGIVTANNIDFVRPWLDMHGINSTYLHSQYKDKHLLTSRVLVEDNPTQEYLPHQKLVMRTQPWNKGVFAHERITYSRQLIPLFESYEREGLIRKK